MYNAEIRIPYCELSGLCKVGLEIGLQAFILHFGLNLKSEDEFH